MYISYMRFLPLETEITCQNAQPALGMFSYVWSVEFYSRNIINIPGRCAKTNSKKLVCSLKKI